MLERRRIARDLHDTALQDLQALALKMHLFAQGLPHAHPNRPLVDSLVDAAESVVEVCRSSICGMRRGQQSDLFVTLDATARELSAWGRHRVRVVASGELRPLQAAIGRHIHLFCREALVNILKHSRGTLAQVELDRTHDWLEVRVWSHAAALQPRGVLRLDESVGRWGIHGMAERAAELGATLQIEHVAGRGPTLTLRVPGSDAYAEP